MKYEAFVKDFSQKALRRENGTMTPPLYIKLYDKNLDMVMPSLL